VSQPDLAKQYPLILTTGARHTAFQHSHYRQIPWLRELRPDNVLEINPATAAELGISNRDRVFVESPKGKIKVRALLTEGIHPKVVHTYHGWYFPSKPFTHKFNLALDWMEQNVNVLADEEHKDPDIGAYGLRAYLVKVYKAD
jgi:anaerobic selenocysteine-containing dehydrogenase